MLPIRTILHPTDFSPCSRFARELARSIALEYGALLVVVHVPTLKLVPGGPGSRSAIEDCHIAESEARLRRIFEDDFDVKAMIHVRDGEPVRAILDVAHEVHADIIVMGTNGLSVTGQPVLGRVTEGVMRGASCPVFTVKDRVGFAAPPAPPLTCARA